MVENINKKILNKIEILEVDEKIKNYIKDVLLFEIEHMDESKFKYKEDYLKMMKKYAEGYEGSDNIEN